METNNLIKKIDIEKINTIVNNISKTIPQSYKPSEKKASVITSGCSCKGMCTGVATIW